jgi:1,4-alpha-glucan branching enzyme
VSLLQNHDQVGNRAFGERIAELVPPRPLRAGMAVMLLAPAVPLLFMGEEYGELNRFTFFCDFGPKLARAVTEGRRREFARFPAFNDPEAQRRIPDPSLPDTYRGSKLDWRRLDIPDHAAWLEYYRGLLRLRREHIMPRLAGMGAGNSRVELLGEQAAAIEWRMSDGCTLQLLANLGPDAVHLARVPRWPVLFASDADIVPTLEIGTLPPWSAVWYLENKNE